ncbi:envelope integrity protein Cei [Williamsia soli]|uniref:envelope integrity protein Cei n=1 Tax=Williamsia soli TaxID=364929 RepID=UPI001A9CDB21|nr:envelope integrity protein Cei [Williamsia soli]
MVSQITYGYPTDDRGRPFRRRRYLPAVIVAVVLTLIAAVVWISALSTSEATAAPTDCPPPPAPSAAPDTAAPAVGTTAGRDEMLQVPPAALASFQIRVLNATDEQGKAQTVLDDLTSLGFQAAPEAAYGDDTLYPDQNLDCFGQIRFGDAGKAAAAAVWIAAPCTELINDGRPGNGVDLSIGEHFSESEQNQDALAVLDTLRAANPQDPNTGADPAVIAAVHEASC